jgi:L-iditol 2-dehydrogenase
MRVAVYYSNEDVRVEERPVPRIGDEEILVKVWASGLCGSDVMEWYRIKKTPRVLGHEIAGEIVELGKNVKKFKNGDRVFVSHHIPCNTCHYCLNGHYSVCDTLRSTNFDPGGFAEYIRVPEINVDRGVFLLPDDMSYEEGSFIEPLACVVRGQRKANVRPGDSVLVIGSGLSGLLHVQLACATGAGRVIATDINADRMDAAKKFGAGEVIHAGEDVPMRLKENLGGRLADVVIICTAAEPAIAQGLRSADRGGTILFFAPTEPGVIIPLPLWEIWHDGITMTCSYAGSPRDIEVAIELIRAKRIPVEEMITHRLSLDEAPTGFDLVARAEDCIKVIIEPQR